jgi:hypothetical protein
LVEVRTSERERERERDTEKQTDAFCCTTNKTFPVVVVHHIIAFIVDTNISVRNARRRARAPERSARAYGTLSQLAFCSYIVSISLFCFAFRNTQVAHVADANLHYFVCFAADQLAQVIVPKKKKKKKRFDSIRSIERTQKKAIDRRRV